MKRFLYLLKMEFLINDEAFRNWRMIIYLSILALTMIASGHSADRKIFKIAQLNDKLKMLKSELWCSPKIVVFIVMLKALLSAMS